MVLPVSRRDTTPRVLTQQGPCLWEAPPFRSGEDVTAGQAGANDFHGFCRWVDRTAQVCTMHHEGRIAVAFAYVVGATVAGHVGL